MNHAFAPSFVPPPPHPRPRGARTAAAALVGVVMLALAVGAALGTRGELDSLLGALDVQALKQGEAALGHEIERHRARALAEIKFLVGDTRVRGTVMAPEFDEATVRDVLDDLNQASDAVMLAVIDVAGQVRAVSGMDGLREMNLGSASVIKAALTRPTAEVWTFPGRMLVVGVAPILSGDRAVSLLMMGFEIGAPALGAIERALGITGGLVLADRLVAGDATSPDRLPALDAARSLTEGVSLLHHGGRQFLVSTSRTSDSAAAGRVVWLLPRHHQLSRAGLLPLGLWSPVALVGLTLVLMVALKRK